MADEVHPARGHGSGERPDDPVRLAPGTVLGGRFRIVELIGRGGMSEVYRAVDLTLDQDVALKLLPELDDVDPECLAALLNEVRLARCISHTNVCRVHDVMELDGHHAISMEFVEGQSLAALLRQTGRLSHDSALLIARQLCAGLAAAHDAGIIHRDLKPSNVLIDRDGRARITDFGLAATRLDASQPTQAAGTTSYMAPEQFATGEAAEQSDIYSLGLVLYRMFTGRDAIEPGEAIARAAGLSPRITPTTPSTHVPRLDPAVELTIVRCLENDPGRRPRSVRAVGAGLPGADALAAARSAGELLEPGLLAAVDAARRVPRAAAAAAAVAFVAGLLLAVHWAPRTQFIRLAAPERPAAYLAERARELAGELAGVRVVGGRFGFRYDRAYVERLAASDTSGSPWAALATHEPDAIEFSLRVPSRRATGRPGLSLRDRDLLDSNPARRNPPAEVEIRLDSRGRLRALHALPAVAGHDSLDGGEPWRPWFSAAGLEMSSFQDVAPRPGASRPAGTIRAWVGPGAAGPGSERLVEAIALDGRPVSFEVIEPWNRAAAAAAPPGAALSGSDAVRWIWLIGVLSGAMALAIRNLRRRSADRRGALRVAALMMSLTLAGWFADDLFGFPRLDALRAGLASTVYFSFTAWLFYVALEPTVRRIWPEITVSWIRLLDGRWGDALVGRDVLIGSLFGLSLVLTDRAYQLALPALGASAPRPDLFGFVDSQLQVATGFRYAIGESFWLVRHSIWGALGTVVLLLVLQKIVRNRALSAGGLVILGSLVALPPGAEPFPLILLTLTQMLLFAAVLLRAGVLSTAVGLFVFNLLATYPLTFEMSAWYGDLGIVGGAIAIAIAAWGAFASQTGQSPVGAR